MKGDAERFYLRAGAFFRRCPVNDPNGTMARNADDMVEWGRETQRQACNR